MTPLADALREMFPKGFDHPDTWSCDNQMARRIAHAARADAERERDALREAVRGALSALHLTYTNVPADGSRPHWCHGEPPRFGEHNNICAGMLMAQDEARAALAKEDR